MEIENFVMVSYKHLKIRTNCHVHILEFSIWVDIFNIVYVLMHGLASCPACSKGRQTGLLKFPSVAVELHSW